MPKPDSKIQLPSFKNWEKFAVLYLNLHTIVEGMQQLSDCYFFLMYVMEDKYYSVVCTYHGGDPDERPFCKDDQIHCFNYGTDPNPVSNFAGYYGALLLMNNLVCSTGINLINDIIDKTVDSQNIITMAKTIQSRYLTYDAIHSIYLSKTFSYSSPTLTYITYYYTDTIDLFVTYMSEISNPNGKASQLADCQKAPFFTELQTLYRYKNRLEQLHAQMNTVVLITAGNLEITSDDGDPNNFPYTKSYKNSFRILEQFVDPNYMTNILLTLEIFYNKCDHSGASKAISELKLKLSGSNSQDFINAVYNLPDNSTVVRPISVPDSLSEKNQYAQTEAFTDILTKLFNYLKALSDLIFIYFLELINLANATGDKSGISQNYAKTYLANYKNLYVSKAGLNSVVNSLSLFSNTIPVIEPHRECLYACRTMQCGWDSCSLKMLFKNTIYSKLDPVNTNNDNIIIATKRMANDLSPGTNPTSTLHSSIYDVVHNPFTSYGPPATTFPMSNDACSGWKSDFGKWLQSTQRTDMFKDLLTYDQLVSDVIFNYMVSYIST